MKIKIDHERMADGGVKGDLKGWPAESWSGERGFPEGYSFQMYSPEPRKVRVALQVKTSAGHDRCLKSNERRDLKKALVAHYSSLFPNCVLTV